MVDIVDQLASLNLAIQALAVRSRPIQPEIQELEAAKRGVDDMRLRLWAVLKGVHANDPKAFEERFRVQRAAELCVRLTTDLRSGAMNPDHAEFAELWTAVVDLNRAIGDTRDQPA